MNVPCRQLRSEWPPNEGLMLGNKRFDAMLKSIRKDGIQEPLTINLAWFVLDGHHRLAVARFLGIETINVKVWTGVEFFE